MLKQMVHIVDVPYPFHALLLLAPPTLTLISFVHSMCVCVCVCVYIYIYIYIYIYLFIYDSTINGY